ncbi:ParB N-terminal domain-containing protein [Actinomadura latina]|uniref:ParB N-terminal domain-containing protein n=1 Tax=Actinomadura latina TaxID=163603 RepID=A0A846YX30_9ACTN|nr:ParB N-terminal domain-containing protein [Actinomadura latina]NKZ03154.1 ParB N-terminal domain-containing protein [Actinomadura latina]
MELEVTWVRFSVINHRTQAEQIREQRKAGRDDLFSRDPLGKEAQDAQYRILCEQEGFDDLKSDLKARSQQEPAIVTADGVLINGNRRSAAMRSLFLDDDVRTARYVKCLVLPADASAAELVDLETELQVARDFKQDYSWINEALLIEKLYERENKNFKRVAERVHRKPEEVRDYYEKIQQVHQLVALSNGTRDYVDFIPNESAFAELAKHVRNKPETEAKAVKDVYFLGTLAGVEYRNLRHLRRPDAADLVVDELRSNTTLAPLLDALPQASESAPSSEDDDLLDSFLDDGPAVSEPLEDLLTLVAKKGPEDTVQIADKGPIEMGDLLTSLRDVVKRAAQEAAEDTQDRREITAPVERAEKATLELKRAIDALPRARRYDEWDEAEFSATIEKLDELLRTLKGAS